jgi:hypothetical protein
MLDTFVDAAASALNISEKQTDNKILIMVNILLLKCITSKFDHALKNWTLYQEKILAEMILG